MEGEASGLGIEGEEVVVVADVRSRRRSLHLLAAVVDVAVMDEEVGSLTCLLGSSVVVVAPPDAS